MRWFGETWNAPCCDRLNHMATPVGEACRYCRRAIEVTDQGVLIAAGHFHRVCFFGHLGMPLTLHILRYGIALCRFSNEVPAKWPMGNFWTSARAEATCTECRRVYDEQRAQ